MSALGFDSSILSAFARAARLETLRELTDGHQRVTTNAVVEELQRGRAAYPRLGDAVNTSWIEVVRVDSLAALRVVLIDDQPAVDAARARGVQVRRSLALVASGIETQKLTRAEAIALVDELVVAGGARFPCDGSGFLSWAEHRGLITP